MIQVHVRKQGGAAVITVPSDVLKLLNIHIGDALALDMTDGGLTLYPVSKKTRKRYSKAELLKGATPKNMKALKDQTKWFRDSKSVGREIP